MISKEFDEYLKGIGCKVRGNYYILDRISTEFYLKIDANPIEDREENNNVDIYIVSIPDWHHIRLSDCDINLTKSILSAVATKRFV